MNSEINSTNRLINRSIEGDPTAFAQLFDQFEASLRQLCRRRFEMGLTRRFDISDVIQETRIEAFQRLKEFAERRPMPLGVWLQRTALQQLADLQRFHVKTAKRSLRREQHAMGNSSNELCNTLVQSGITPSKIVSAEEEARRVRLALDKIEVQDREILLMRYVEEQTNREIAFLLGISDSAVSQRHGMALLRLRKALNQL